MVIPHMVRSCFVNIDAACRAALAVDADAGADVWYADANAGFGDALGGGLCWKTGIDAVAMDSLDRTRSRGYVVPLQ